MTEFKINISAEKFTRKLKNSLKRRMLKVVIRLEAHAKQLISISNQGGSQPSRPGQPPRAGTGNLRNSLTHQVVSEGNDIVGIFGVLKGPGASYARRLELGFFGSDSAGRFFSMEPRPYLRPTYTKNKRRIMQILVK